MKTLLRWTLLAVCWLSGPHLGVAQSKERHLLYVVAPGIRNYLEFGGAGILVFDMDKDYSFVKRIETPASRRERPENIKGVCASAASGNLYFSTLTRLFCVDLVTEKTLWEKALPGGCDRMSITPDGKTIYVPSLEGPHWNIVDAATGDVIKQVITNSRAHNTVCSLDGCHIYMAGLKSPLLTVVDAQTRQEGPKIGPFSAAVRPFTVNSARTLCFVTVNDLLGFEVGDLTTGKRLHRVEVQGFKRGPTKRHGCPSHGIGLTPDEKEVWVCDSANQHLHVFDATVLPPKQIAGIKLREEPGWVTFSLDGQHAFPSTGEIIDTKTKKIVAALKDERDREVHSEKMVEVVFEGDKPIRTGDQFGVGRASSVALQTSARSATKGAKSNELWVYVGTYTGKNSKGIYRFTLDLASGRLTGGELAAESKNPSFLAIHPNQQFLYAVGKYAGRDGKGGGGVNAFAIDRKTGSLKLLNQQSAGGAGPCHIVVDKQGKNVLVANYGGGSASVLPIQPDGSLLKATGFAQHKGASVNPQRQEGPHAHSINLDPANKFAFVADLGLDKVIVYRFDAAHGTLKPNDPPAAKVADGAGPRHFAFHPTSKFAYAINELNNTVTAFSYDAGQGALREVQMISTLPEDFRGTSYCAEVVVHPSGKFLYGSNRGHNSIAVFRIDPETGKLTATGHQASGIKTPRNFVVDPTGTYMLVANQDADSMVVFRIDAATGELSPTGHVAKVPFPVCIRMMASPE